MYACLFSNGDHTVSLTRIDFPVVERGVSFLPSRCERPLWLILHMAAGQIGPSFLQGEKLRPHAFI